eukprot:TRINITY_DN6344_c0_g1_i6.p2 TRINITY_DN6344_c0_g1~~TRINITY_DN6344_c0_g1_i6.p2  ORF type:complete len:658 (+),score=243.67 TRINITY_DN6344_c0_g1_i6:2183-4156(+)
MPPTCSGRTELCDSVLNDHWVSVPTGSEDGFKSTRKNQYEEMLFKCEDDRFELDLVIELNASTIRVLEPIYKLLNDMSEEETARAKLDTMLDVCHVRSIERIYGERGPDVVDALYSNPSMTIPVVLKRLKQKDQEWTKARREWNKIWREVNERNYYKSLDHQSFNFKQNDKKYLNSKVLLAEIKQKYADHIKQQRRKLAEKINSSREGTDGQHGNNENDKEKGEKGESNQVDIDTIKEKSESSEEESSSELNEMLPSKEMLKKLASGKRENVSHLKYHFGDNSVFNHIHELVAFYAEKSLSSGEGEKIDTFFKHFMRVFFTMESHDNGNGAAAPSSSAPASGPAAPATGSAPMEVDTQPEHEPKIKSASNVFFGNNAFYAFFRFFQISYERIVKAKELSQMPSTNSNLTFLLNPTKGGKIENPADKFQSFIKSLYELIGGSKDQNLYEDELRGLFGIESYILFTLDRLIIHLTKQLQTLLSEENCSKLLALYSHTISKPPINESLYYARCIEILDDERCFRFEFEKAPNRGDFKIQLLDSFHNPPQFVDIEKEKWAQYVEKYLGTDETNLDPRKQHVFLLRNQKGVDKDSEDALKDVEMDIGLECRISLSNFHLFYVENTTDFIHRRNRHGPVVREKDRKQRQEHLDRALEKIKAKE